MEGHGGGHGQTGAWMESPTMSELGRSGQEAETGRVMRP